MGRRSTPNSRRDDEEKKTIVLHRPPSPRSGAELGLHPLKHAPVQVVRFLFPAEHANRGDTVERHLAKRGEELAPVDVAIADLVVLVDPRICSWRVNDVAVGLPQLMVVAVGDVQVLQPISGVAQHAADVTGAVG